MKLKERLKRTGQDGYWRVDGADEIRVSSRLGTQYVVHFSGIHESEKGKPFASHALNGKTLSHPAHTAEIRDFSIGSVWHNGIRCWGPEQVDSSFTVNTSKVRNVSLGEIFELNERQIGSVVPERYMRLGDNRERLKSMRFSVLPVTAPNAAKWLVVPHTSIARFYYGVSSRFMSGCISSDLEQYVDWGRCRMEDGRPLISIKTALSRKEMQVIARAVASEKAKEALFSINKSLRVRHTNNATASDTSRSDLSMAATFPFLGETTLYVAGKRMPLWTQEDQTGEWAVYAMSISHCTRHPGFSSLIVECDDLVNGRGDQNPGGQSSGNPLFNPLIEDEDDLEVVEAPADGRLKNISFRTYGNQFGIPYFDIEYRRLITKVSIGASPSTVIDVPVDGASHNDPSSSADGKGKIGIQDFQSEVTPDRQLSEFIEMIKCLRALTEERRWHIVSRNKRDSDIAIGTDFLITFPLKAGKRYTWHLVSDGGAPRARQAAWIEIQIRPDCTIYLLEMELRPGEAGQCTLIAHLNDFSVMDEKTVDNLLRLTAIKHRWPSNHNTWDKIEHQELANEVLGQLTLHKIDHPPKARKKAKDNASTATDENKLSPSETYVKHWATSMLRNLDDQLQI